MQRRRFIRPFPNDVADADQIGQLILRVKLGVSIADRSQADDGCASKS